MFQQISHTRLLPSRMEEDQHFCLKWNNYQSNMTAVFDQLRENEAFVDVTLACEGSQLKAHKVRSRIAIAARSSALRSPCRRWAHHAVIGRMVVDVLEWLGIAGLGTLTLFWCYFFICLVQHDAIITLLPVYHHLGKFFTQGCAEFMQ